MQSIVIMKAALFIVLLLVAYFGFELLRNHKIITDAVENVYERTKAQEERRLSEQ